MTQTNQSRLTLIQLPDNQEGAEASLTNDGTCTLLWWNKGNDLDGWWVKGELYDPDGDNIEILTDETLADLQDRIDENYGLRVSNKTN